MTDRVFHDGTESMTDLFERERALASGLRELLREASRREADAVALRDETLKTADERRHARVSRAERRLAETEASANTTEAEELRTLETGAAESESQTKQTYDARLGAAKERHHRAVDRIEREFKEAAWLADTVLESGRPRPIAVCTELEKKLDKGLDKLEELVAFVGTLWPTVATPQPPSIDGGADEPAFAERVETLGDEARAIEAMPGAKFFRSGLPIVVVPGLAAAAGGGLGFATGWTSWGLAAGVGGGVLVLAGGLMVPLGRGARRRFRDRVQAFAESIGEARARAASERLAGQERRDTEIEALEAQRSKDVQKAKATAAARRERQESDYQARTAELESERDRELAAHRAKSDARRASVEQTGAAARSEARAASENELRTARSEHEAETAEASDVYHAATRSLHELVNERTAEAMSQLEQIGRYLDSDCPRWNDRLSGAWTPRRDRRFGVRIGEVRLDVEGQSEGVGLFEDLLPAEIALPIVVDVASRGSLLLEAGRDGRDDAIALLQSTLVSLLATAPPGRAKLTLFDPVGRGRSFAGLMRLTDHDESLVGARVWTESRHMEQRLADLTEHIENVIQKYLRDDYASIDEYNRIAGEIAEPYRFLVIADFPTNMTEDAAARLASIVDAGARCGVHVFMLADPEGKMPPGFDLDELRKRAIVLEHADGSFRVADDALGGLPLVLEEAPSEAETVELLRLVGEGAIDAGRVEVRYKVLEPPADRVWTRSCADELRVPLGRAGATKVQELRLGRGTSQHSLVAGKTGSGKSTLLHVLATSAMLWHSPDEVEFYLVDFKKGVEFKPYASGRLPHVRAVAIESDREFGLSVLQRLDGELRRRGDLFRDHGVQSLAHFREKFPEEPMPRSLLMIDEFQEFFVEDDRIAQDAALLLDRLVRQGRAFGIHVLLASQTLSGAYTLGRSTMGQMAVRIALKCSETDSYLILSEDNGAARLLTRPGEAIYNDANGLVEGNNPFQVAWLGDEERAEVLRRVAARSEAASVTFEEPVFFEGNAAAELERNRSLRRAVRERARPVAPVAWLGEPVSIKDPTGAVMRRRGGSNLLIVGQRSETAAAMLSAGAVSLAAQHDASGEKAASFVVIDGTPEDDPLCRRLASSLEPLSHEVRPVAWSDAESAVNELHREVTERESANRTDGPPIYVLVNGLHWLRALRRKDDDFGFSMSGEDKGPSADQQFKTILLEGPRVGVFVLCWCDTASSLNRALDRASIGEFGSRALMQMSANDSSYLIESTSAGKLGLHRAIFFDEESGTEEKFRPYSLPAPSLVGSLVQPDS